MFTKMSRDLPISFIISFNKIRKDAFLTNLELKHLAVRETQGIDNLRSDCDIESDGKEATANRV